MKDCVTWFWRVLSGWHLWENASPDFDEHWAAGTYERLCHLILASTERLALMRYCVTWFWRVLSGWHLWEIASPDFGEYWAAGTYERLCHLILASTERQPPSLAHCPPSDSWNLRHLCFNTKKQPFLHLNILLYKEVLQLWTINLIKCSPEKYYDGDCPWSVAAVYYSDSSVLRSGTMPVIT